MDRGVGTPQVAAVAVAAAARGQLLWFGGAASKTSPSHNYDFVFTLPCPFLTDGGRGAAHTETIRS